MKLPRPGRRPRPGHRPAGRSVTAVLLTSLLALTAACSSASGTDDATGNDGETALLTIGQADKVMNLDPVQPPTGGRETRAVKRQIFDALVVQGRDLVPAPQLARSWSNPDELTWVFTLRDDVTFHDGEKFTAATAKFNLDRILDPKNNASWQTQLAALVAEVSVKGDHELVIKTKAPAPTLLTILAFQEIVPQQYLEKVGAAEFNAKPIGTGPYKFVSRTEDRIILERNDDYWGGKPKARQLAFQTIPDVAARIAALQAGEINIADKIPTDLADTLTGGVKAVSASGTRIYFLAMNVTAAPFTDVGVRQAVGSVINTEELAKSLYKGRAQALNQPAFPQMFGYQKQAAGFSFAPQPATATLKSVGAPVTVDIKQSDLTLAQAVVGQLTSAGLKVKLQPLEDEAFNEAISTGRSQAYLGSWGVAEGDLDAIVGRHFWSQRGDDSRYTNYESAALDALIEHARGTADQPTRLADYAKVIDLLVRDAPWRPLVTPDEMYGVSSSLQGWEPSPTGIYHLTEAYLAG
ncbi:ABC transporter substrate-binding protein [Micromonospora haikouensis]|uniref:ABC transporter substrate-binding protein n=1 Tax=Micromonospora haikouensis TaxID=686309 RepID=UPI003D7082B4